MLLCMPWHHDKRFTHFSLSKIFQIKFNRSFLDPGKDQYGAAFSVCVMQLPHKNPIVNALQS